MVDIVKFPGANVSDDYDDAIPRQLDVGRGQLPRRLSKPTIYFAGRMDFSKGNDDWRKNVDNFPKYEVGIGEYEFYPDFKIDCKTYWYGGPFALDSCSGHSSGHCGFAIEHQRIWDCDRHWIERADLVVAYLADLKAYGTLVEIGYAGANNKPIALGFSDDLGPRDYAELWLCRMLASKVYFGLPDLFWREVRRDWLRQRHT